MQPGYFIGRLDVDLYYLHIMVGLYQFQPYGKARYQMQMWTTIFVYSIYMDLLYFMIVVISHEYMTNSFSNGSN